MKLTLFLRSQAGRRAILKTQAMLNSKRINIETIGLGPNFNTRE